MIHHKVAQGTDAWLNLRAGIPTASCFDKIVTAKKLEVSKTADFFQDVLVRARAWNAKRIAATPPFLRGRDERVMARDECGRLKTKSAAGGKR